MPRDDGTLEVKWAQRYYFANLGQLFADGLSTSACGRLEEVEPEAYYERTGHDGGGLRVPADLEESIRRYLQLSPANQARFYRAAFWLDIALHQWALSASASFASLVSSIESLSVRGETHRTYCERCKAESQHDAPGATEQFRAFFDEHAPGAALRKRRSEMYRVRSDVLHGSDLMYLGQELGSITDPLYWNDWELYDDLSGLTRIALRSWLKSATTS